MNSKPIKIKTMKTYQSFSFNKKQSDFFNANKRGMENISMVYFNDVVYVRDHKSDELIIVPVTNVAFMYPFKSSELEIMGKERAELEDQLARIEEEKAALEQKFQELEQIREEEAKVQEEQERIDDLFMGVDENAEESEGSEDSDESEELDPDYEHHDPGAR